MKTTFLLGLLMALCLTLVGCGLNKDAEITAFAGELEKTTNEMVAKIDASPTAKGVDEAQKVLDAKKDSIKKTVGEFKKATGYVSQDAQKKLNESMARTSKTLTDTASKHAMALAKDPGAMPKFQKLMTDYAAMLQ